MKVFIWLIASGVFFSGVKASESRSYCIKQLNKYTDVRRTSLKPLKSDEFYYAFKAATEENVTDRDNGLVKYFVDFQRDFAIKEMNLLYRDKMSFKAAGNAVLELGLLALGGAMVKSVLHSRYLARVKKNMEGLVPGQVGFNPGKYQQMVDDFYKYNSRTLNYFPENQIAAQLAAQYGKQSMGLWMAEFVGVGAIYDLFSRRSAKANLAAYQCLMLSKAKVYVENARVWSESQRCRFDFIDDRMLSLGVKKYQALKRKRLLMQAQCVQGEFFDG